MKLFENEFAGIFGDPYTVAQFEEGLPAEIKVSDTDYCEASIGNGPPIELAELEEVLSHIDPTMADDRCQWIGCTKAVVFDIPIVERDVDREALADRWCSGDLWRERTGDPSFGVETYRGWDRIRSEIGGPGYDGSKTTLLTLYWLAERSGSGYRRPSLMDRVPITEIAVDNEEGAAADRKERSWRQRSFRPKSEAEMENLPPPRWLVEDVLVEHSLVMFYGKEDAYKSFVVQDLVLSGAAGLSWPAKSPDGLKPLTSIYIAGEGARGVGTDRRQGWRQANDIDPQHELPFYVIDEMPHVQSAVDINQLINDIEAKGVTPDIVVLDTVVRAMTGLDENSSKESGLFVAACDRVRQRFGCVVIAIHHSGKDPSNGARGSSNLTASFDTRFRVEADNQLKFVEITNEKQKDAECWDHPTHLQGQIVCLEGDGGRTTLVFRKSDRPPQRKDLMKEAERIDEVRAALLARGGDKRLVANKELAEAIVEQKLALDDTLATKAGEDARPTMVNSEMTRLRRNAWNKKTGKPGILHQLLASDPDDGRYLWHVPEPLEEAD